MQKAQESTTLQGMHTHTHKLWQYKEGETSYYFFLFESVAVDDDSAATAFGYQHKKCYEINRFFMNKN